MAYVRTDASPNEVLHHPVHAHPPGLSSLCMSQRCDTPHHSHTALSRDRTLPITSFGTLDGQAVNLIDPEPDPRCRPQHLHRPAQLTSSVGEHHRRGQLLRQTRRPPPPPPPTCANNDSPPARSSTGAMSLPMNCTDVAPTRLAAAQDAALSFVRALPPGINLGGILRCIGGRAGQSHHRSGACGARHPHPRTGPEHRHRRRTRGRAERHRRGQPAHPRGSGTTSGADCVDERRQTKRRPRRIRRGPPSQSSAYPDQHHLPISTISFGTPYGTVDIDGEQDPVPVDDASLARIAQPSGGSSIPPKATRKSTRFTTPWLTKLATKPSAATSANPG